MARYIDADKIVFWIRYVSSNGLESDVRKIAFSDEIERMPTVDVMPKSEVDYARQDGYENGKRDAAREIFKEIENLLGEHIIWKCCTPWKYQDYAELKKKYIKE